MNTITTRRSARARGVFRGSWRARESHAAASFSRVGSVNSVEGERAVTNGAAMATTVIGSQQKPGQNQEQRDQERKRA